MSTTVEQRAALPFKPHEAADGQRPLVSKLYQTIGVIDSVIQELGNFQNGDSESLLTSQVISSLAKAKERMLRKLPVLIFQSPASAGVEPSPQGFQRNGKSQTLTEPTEETEHLGRIALKTDEPVVEPSPSTSDNKDGRRLISSFQVLNILQVSAAEVGQAINELGFTPPIVNNQQYTSYFLSIDEITKLRDYCLQKKIREEELVNPKPVLISVAEAVAVQPLLPEGAVFTEELLKQLGISYETLRKRCKEMGIMPSSLGRKKFYLKEQQETIIKNLAGNRQRTKTKIKIRKTRPRTELDFDDLNLQELEEEEVEVEEYCPEEGGDSLDLISVHIQEMKRHPIQPEMHEKWGAQIFSGQLAMRALMEIAKSHLGTATQNETIEELLKDKKVKFLLQNFNLSLVNVLRRLNEYSNEKNRQEDMEFVQIVDSHANWLQTQIERAKGIETNKIREESLQKIIDHQVALAKQGVDSHEKLVVGNLALAFAWAKRYQGRGLELADLIGYGHEGLIYAAAKFDFRRGYKFSTYAIWWIKQRITRAIVDFGSTIRLPSYITDKSSRFAKVWERLTQEFGREPTFEELAKEFGSGAANLIKALQIRATRSLNDEVGNDEHSKTLFDHTELQDLIKDRSEDVEEEGEKDELKRTIREVLTELSPRARRILILRYGLEDGKERTLEEVGREFNVTRERIRQIEAKALRELRHSLRSRVLQDFREKDSKATRTTGARELGIRKNRRLLERAGSLAKA